MHSVLKTAGIVVGAGAASWLVFTVPAYYSAESQRGSTERLVSLEKEKALNAQRDLEALQRSIGELSLKITSEGQELGQLTKQTAEAKAKLKALEALQEEKRRSLEESKQTLVQKQASMQSSKEQWNMHSLVVQKKQEELLAAEVRARAARDEMNPLNNPMIKRLLSR